MVRSFQLLHEGWDAIVAQTRRQSHFARGHHKSLTRLRLPSGSQPKAQKPVDGSLEGLPGAPHLVFHQLGHIVVDGKRCSHILMLWNKAS